MGKTQQPTQEFPVKVIHGDYRKGRGHWFRATVLPKNKIHARFDMKTKEGDTKTLPIESLVRFEQTTSGKFRVGDWMTHYLFPYSASISMAGMCASIVQLQGMERASRRVRFICTTVNQYFCGEIAQNGFRLVQELVQQAEQACAGEQENFR